MISTYRTTPKGIVAAPHGTTHRNTRIIPVWRVRYLSGTPAPNVPENSSAGGPSPQACDERQSCVCVAERLGGVEVVGGGR
jgi:hypothetical protein